MGIVNIADIANVVDISTDIADIGMDIADIGMDIADIATNIAVETGRCVQGVTGVSCDSTPPLNSSSCEIGL